MREHENSFTHCKNIFEVMTKTALKGKEIDVLYCIIDTDIFVFQAFKVVKIDIEQFAAGMNIDLAEAQVIVHRKPETLLEAKQMIADSLADFEKKTEQIKEVVIKEVKEDVLKTTQEAAEIKENIQQLVGDVAADAIDYAAEYLKLKNQLEKITTELAAYKEKYGELVVEETEVTEVIKEEVVEKINEE